MGTFSKSGSGCRQGSSSHTDKFSYNDLQFESERLLDASTADNTKSEYATGLSSFERFRSEYDLPQSWPPEVDTISLYIAWLSLQGFTCNTARLYVNAIWFQCKVLNHVDVTKVFIVQKGLEGLKRTCRQKRIRLPITLNLLSSTLRILPNTCANKYETLLFTAAYCLAFFAFLRVSELTASSKGSANNTLQASDISIDAGKRNLLMLSFVNLKLTNMVLGPGFRYVKQVRSPVQLWL